MKAHHSLSLSLFASVAFLATAPLAQAQTRPDGTPVNPPGTAAGRAVDRALGTNTTVANPADAASGANTAAPTSGAATVSVDAASLRGALSARRLIDADVYGANDREVGEVEDLIIPAGGAGGPIAVLSVGGFLGMGERHVAVPFSQLQHNADRDRWTLPGATQETLRAMPAFNLDEFGRGRSRANAARQVGDSATGTAATDGTTPRPGALGGAGSTAGQTTPANPPVR